MLLAGPAQAGSAADEGPRAPVDRTFATPIVSPAGDGERVFVVEQGECWLVRAGTLSTPDFLDITTLVLSGGERGLFSMAFAPDYATSGRFYVYYTAQDPAGELTIAEYRRSANRCGGSVGTYRAVDPAPRREPQWRSAPVRARRLPLHRNGRGGGEGDPDRNGQDLGSLLGKLLRIDPRLGPNGESYTIPTDNPFVGQTGARAEIWSYGRCATRGGSRSTAETGDLTVGDVGQAEWEEVNFVPAGSGAGRTANFGWGCFEGRHVYAPNATRPDCDPLPANHAQPVWEYRHDLRLLDHGRLRRARSGADGALRALPLRRPLRRPGVVDDPAGWTHDDRVTGLEVPSLYSFGEDACGRIYAVSGAGPVYRLHVSGQPNTPTCTPTPPVQPPPAPPPPPPPVLPASPPPPASPQPPRLAHCRVPRVIGLRPAAARTRIRRPTLGRIRYRRAALARGRVLTQAPRPGARRPRGTRQLHGQPRPEA